MLIIGNSFTRDASVYIRDFADKAGEKITVGAYWEGGLTFQNHMEDYDKDMGRRLHLYKAGNTGKEFEYSSSSLYRVARQNKWDVVIFQQASAPSGDYSTFQPYLKQLSDIVKQAAPNAKQMMFETWAYEHNCSNASFSQFNKDQAYMYSCIKDAYSKAAVSIGNVDIVPAGAAFQLARANKLFDTKNGGTTLNVSDGFHANEAGKYLLGATFFSALTGKDVRGVNFQAGGLTGMQMLALKNAAYEANVNYGNITGVKPAATTAKPASTTQKPVAATTAKPQNNNPTAAKNTNPAVAGTTAAANGSADVTDAPVADGTTEAPGSEQIQGTSNAQLVTEPTTAVSGSGDDDGKELIPDVLPIIFAIVGVIVVAGAAVVVLLIIKSKKSK